MFYNLFIELFNEYTNICSIMMDYNENNNEIPEAEDRYIEELVLLLIYLTSWKEDNFNHEVFRSWKGYPFEILDSLTEKNLISGSKRAKSVYLTESGLKKAREIEKKFLENM